MPATQQADSLNDLTCDLIGNAKAIIQFKHDWIKNDNATNNANEPCEVDSEDACSWCLWGALIYGKQSNKRDFGHRTFNHAVTAIAGQIIEDYRDNLQPIHLVKYPNGIIPSDIITYWNDADETTHEQVINIMDKVLERRHPIAQ